MVKAMRLEWIWSRAHQRESCLSCSLLLCSSRRLFSSRRSACKASQMPSQWLIDLSVTQSTYTQHIYRSLAMCWTWQTRLNDYRKKHPHTCLQSSEACLPRRGRCRAAAEVNCRPHTSNSPPGISTCYSFILKSTRRQRVRMGCCFCVFHSLEEILSF